MPVGIVGVSGYTGLELLKILLSHPVFEIAYLANQEGTEDVSHIHPSLVNVCHQPVHKADPKVAKQCCKLIFLALPHQKAMEFAKEALELGLQVVDLSADYRLSQESYERFYTRHIDVENLQHAIYGLVEWQRGLIKKARIVANPGCYPTASLLGLLPFTPYIDSQISVFIDAKSGVSGAGKTLSENTHYTTINENMFAYSPMKHRHSGEIIEKLNRFGRCDLKVQFVPHLTPLTRGMLVSAFVHLKSANIDTLAILKDCYKGERSIRIATEPVRIKDVVGTHFCNIYIQQDGKDLWINVAIDNLLRGASSQAIVNANLMCGIEELTAIPMFAYVP
ncbi:N-acetyl-gamma-glutamyl-phosphate reductase [Helicobacter monodelphidis]|nr:N-acetyl-gamma-glutamyl-phosphate reductase [Helicobacter sp. 15-1451]